MSSPCFQGIPAGRLNGNIRPSYWALMVIKNKNSCAFPHVSDGFPFWRQCGHRRPAHRVGSGCSAVSVTSRPRGTRAGARHARALSLRQATLATRHLGAGRGPARRADHHPFSRNDGSPKRRRILHGPPGPGRGVRQQRYRTGDTPGTRDSRRGGARQSETPAPSYADCHRSDREFRARRLPIDRETGIDGHGPPGARPAHARESCCRPDRTPPGGSARPAAASPCRGAAPIRGVGWRPCGPPTQLARAESRYGVPGGTGSPLKATEATPARDRQPAGESRSAPDENGTSQSVPSVGAPEWCPSPMPRGIGSDGTSPSM